MGCSPPGAGGVLETPAPLSARPLKATTHLVLNICPFLWTLTAALPEGSGGDAKQITRVLLFATPWTQPMFPNVWYCIDGSQDGTGTNNLMDAP